MLAAGLEDGIEVTTVKREDLVYTLPLECSNQHLSAVYAWHTIPSDRSDRAIVSD
jgi:hypothetical protein